MPKVTELTKARLPRAAPTACRQMGEMPPHSSTISLPASASSAASLSGWRARQQTLSGSRGVDHVQSLTRRTDALPIESLHHQTRQPHAGGIDFSRGPDVIECHQRHIGLLPGQEDQRLALVPTILILNSIGHDKTGMQKSHGAFRRRCVRSVEKPREQFLAGPGAAKLNETQMSLGNARRQGKVKPRHAPPQTCGPQKTTKRLEMLGVLAGVQKEFLLRSRLASN